MTRLLEIGLKLTSQRIAVITELVDDKTHPSALDIHRKAREQVPTLSLSTVYHILSLLKKYHLIKELGFDGMDSRYEADTNSHLNLVCSKCGKIEDFKLNLPVAIELVEKKKGFRTMETRIDYYGLCRECQKAE